MVFWAKIRSYEIICVIGKFLDNFMNYNNLKYMIFDKISTTSTYPFLEVTLTQNWKST